MKPSVLLCEGCGFDLSGSPTEGRCAECGTPIAHSLPSRRVGSPWQREAPLGWFRTLVLILREPEGFWNALQPGGWLTLWLATLNCALAGVLTFAVILVAEVVFSALPPGIVVSSRIQPWELIGLVVILPALCLLFTGIETLGLIVLGRRHGWRVGPSVSGAVCAHASYGWLLAGLGIGLGYTLSVALGLAESPPRWTRGVVGLGWLLEIILQPRVVPPLLGGLVGLFAFEWLAWFGIKRCRWVNSIASVGVGSGHVQSATNTTDHPR